MRGATNSTFKDQPVVLYNQSGVVVTKYGNLVNVAVSMFTGVGQTNIPNMPKARAYQGTALLGNSSNYAGAMWINPNDTVIAINRVTSGDYLFGGMNYLTDEGGGRKLSRLLRLFRRRGA